MPLWRRPLWAIVQNMTIGQLPAALRQQYELPWRWRDRALFASVCAWARVMRFLFPRYLGRSQVAVFAARRRRGELKPASATSGGAGTAAAVPAES
jgi:uncharacterized protein (DUF2236 family)